MSGGFNRRQKGGKGKLRRLQGDVEGGDFGLLRMEKDLKMEAGI